MDSIRLKSLLDNYLSNRGLSEVELRELHSYLNAEEYREEIEGFIECQYRSVTESQMSFFSNENELDTFVNNVMAQRFMPNSETIETDNTSSPVKRWTVFNIFSKKWLAAAVLLSIVLMVSIWRFMVSHDETSSVTDDAAVSKSRDSFNNDVPAGTQGAILDLADGKKIQFGVLSKQKHRPDDVLPFSTLSPKLSASDTHTMNTLETPKAREFAIELPDGTRVWVNADTKLYFPSSFSDSVRHVKIIGEAYFEVAHDRKKPFVVNVNDKAEVWVLGTHFNIAAYRTDSVSRVSLIEGAIKLKYKNREAILKPHEQAVFKIGTSELEIRKNINTQQVQAWQQGYFDFTNLNIYEIMEQIGKWYNIEPVFQGQINKDVFYGRISKTVGLKEILHILENSKMHFKIEGKKLIIKP